MRNGLRNLLYSGLIASSIVGGCGDISADVVSGAGELEGKSVLVKKDEGKSEVYDLSGVLKKNGEKTRNDIWGDGLRENPSFDFQRCIPSLGNGSDLSLLANYRADLGVVYGDTSFGESNPVVGDFGSSRYDVGGFENSLSMRTASSEVSRFMYGGIGLGARAYSNNLKDSSIDVLAVSEPSSLALLGLGALMVGGGYALKRKDLK